MDDTTKRLRYLREHEPKRFAEALLQMSDAEAEAILYDWNIWGRANQLPPAHKKWRTWLILAGRGFGKAVKDNTRILTANRGFIDIGDITNEDIVYSENGSQTRVTEVFKPEVSKAFRLVFDDKTMIDACEDHLWEIVHRSGEKEVVPTSSLTSKGSGPLYVRLTKPIDFNSVQHLNIHPYVLGAWLGDGINKAPEIVCGKEDVSEMAENVRSCGYEVEIVQKTETVFNLKLSLKDSEVGRKPYNGKCAGEWNSAHDRHIEKYATGFEHGAWAKYKGQKEKFYHRLKDLNLIKNKHIPPEYLTSSLEDRTNLLKGLLDTDGYSSKKGHIEFCSMNKNLAEGVLFLARSLGDKAQMTEGRATLYGKDCGTKYRVFIKSLCTRFNLKRKAHRHGVSKSDGVTFNWTHKKLISVTPIPVEGGYTCITVESGNSLFLVGEELTVTHNTRTANEWIIQRAREGKGPIALIGKTTADVRDTIIEVGESSILRISPPNFMPLYEPSKRRLTWPNGVVATTFSGDEWPQLRGPQHRSVLIDELPKFASPEDLYTQMDMGLRIGNDAACVISTTPLPIKIIKELYLKAQDQNSSIVITTGSTLDNVANLGKQSVESMIERYKGTRMERQELYGEILWESESSLFKSSDIDKYRVDSHPELKRIIVAVDPAVSTTTSSDDTGIIVAGLGVNNEMYVLADRTMKGTPQQWASRVGELYRHYEADSVIAEKNQGGDMVMTTLQSFGGNIPVKLVTATKGKMLRAEGPSLLFEQGKIHMVGNFQELEQQMVMYDGTQRKSPDNLDAFIWAATELMLGKQRAPVKSFEFHI